MPRPFFNPPPIATRVIPVIDGDFDVFEVNHDLEEQLRESEYATFYHDARDSEQ